MRGADRFTESLFTVSRLEGFIPADHPLRPIRAMVNQALVQMDVLFSSMYAADVKGGRPSIAPEKLIRAMLLQVFYSVRSKAHADGADPLQPVVSLVHRACHRGRGLGAHGIHQEPGALD